MVMADEERVVSVADEGPVLNIADEGSVLNIADEGSVISVPDTSEDFTCSQCLETFEDRSSLFRHVHARHQQHVHSHVHSRRKFRCERCERTFKSMTGLRNHARTHPGFFVFPLDTTLDGSLISQPGSTTIDDNNDNVLIHSSIDARDCVLENTTSVEPEGAECDVDIKGNKFVKELETEPLVVSNVDKSTSSETEILLTPSIGNRKSERRRSGIPVPVRRSFHVVCENIQEQSDPRNIGVKEISSTNDKREHFAHTSGSTITKTQTSAAHVKKELSSKRLPQSPFGKKYKTKAPCPLTPSRSKGTLNIEQSGSPLRKRTPLHKNRTPKSAGKCINSTGSRSSTSHKNRSTPKQLTPRNIFTNSPNSTKKNKLDGEMFICKKCGKSFVDRAKLNVHFAVHSRETPERCGIEKRLVKRNIASQMPITSPFVDKEIPKKFPCQKCDQKFENEALLNNHVTSHGVKTLSCPHCDKKFRFQTSLKAHSFVHQGEATHQVTFDTTYKTRATENKTVSMETSSPNPEKLNIFSLLSASGCSDDYLPFLCKSCDYSTHLPADLLSHMKTHSRKGQFTCKLCHKSYKHQSNLRVHEKIHTINKIKNIIVKNKEIKQQV